MYTPLKTTFFTGAQCALLLVFSFALTPKFANDSIEVDILTQSHADTGICDLSSWLVGDSEGGIELKVGSATTPCECESLVKATKPKASGATFGQVSNGCWAEFKWESPRKPDPNSWIHKYFDSPHRCGEGWEAGNGHGFNEEYIGTAISPCGCEQFVKSIEPKADGATWRREDNECYAEFEIEDYITKGFN